MRRLRPCYHFLDFSISCGCGRLFVSFSWVNREFLVDHIDAPLSRPQWVDFLLALLYLVVFSFGHFPSVLALVGVLVVAFSLYVLHPEPICIGSLEFGAAAKHTVVIALSLLALFVGHVLTLIISLAVFLLIVVGIHASIREHTA